MSHLLVQYFITCSFTDVQMFSDVNKVSLCFINIYNVYYSIQLSFRLLMCIGISFFLFIIGANGVSLLWFHLLKFTTDYNTTFLFPNVSMWLPPMVVFRGRLYANLSLLLIILTMKLFPIEHGNKHHVQLHDLMSHFIIVHYNPKPKK